MLHILKWSVGGLLAMSFFLFLAFLLTTWLIPSHDRKVSRAVVQEERPASSNKPLKLKDRLETSHEDSVAPIKDERTDPHRVSLFNHQESKSDNNQDRGNSLFQMDARSSDAPYKAKKPRPIMSGTQTTPVKAAPKLRAAQRPPDDALEIKKEAVSSDRAVTEESADERRPPDTAGTSSAQSTSPKGTPIDNKRLISTKHVFQEKIVTVPTVGGEEYTYALHSSFGLPKSNGPAQTQTTSQTSEKPAAAPQVLRPRSRPNQRVQKVPPKKKEVQKVDGTSTSEVATSTPPQENLTLSAPRIIGVFDVGSDAWVLIEAPDGKIHELREEYTVNGYFIVDISGKKVKFRSQGRDIILRAGDELAAP